MFSCKICIQWMVLLLVTGWHSCQQVPAHGGEGHWQRSISYQSKQDLFANYQVGPHPCSTTAQMYISPQPVPPHVGHTYTTYQPFMPHEYLHKHRRSHYAHAPGAGWTRTTVRYGTGGLRWQNMWHKLSPPWSNLKLFQELLP